MPMTWRAMSTGPFLDGRLVDVGAVGKREVGAHERDHLSGIALRLLLLAARLVFSGLGAHGVCWREDGAVGVDGERMYGTEGEGGEEERRRGGGRG